MRMSKTFITGILCNSYLLEVNNMKKEVPSIDAWLREAKAHETAPLCGMYLTHNGTVRQTAKAKVCYG